MNREKGGRAYSALSRYYEYLVGDEEYRRWSERVCSAVKRLSKGNTGADIACGSGYFTRALKKAGFDVFGYDISDEMLSEARRISAEEGVYIEYVSGDIKSFKTLNKLGFVTAINDGFNYVEPQNLTRAFKRVAAALKKGGAFIFDVSSEYKLKKVIANNVFSVDEDDFTYIWFNSLTDVGVKMDITVFTREGETYSRRDETHFQYIHTLKSVTESLSAAGFKIAEIKDGNGEEISEISERLCFSAIKE